MTTNCFEECLRDCCEDRCARNGRLGSLTNANAAGCRSCVIVVIVCLFVSVCAVLNELDGLCRSRLANEARSALAFLREKNPQVRYVTSKGAPLPTFAAGTMTEESDDQVRVSVFSFEIRANCSLLLAALLLLLPAMVLLITWIPSNPFPCITSFSTASRVSQESYVLSVGLTSSKILLSFNRDRVLIC